MTTAHAASLPVAVEVECIQCFRPGRWRPDLDPPHVAHPGDTFCMLPPRDCAMCNVDGWLRLLARTELVRPCSRCDHVTAHRTQVRRAQRAAARADAA